MSVFFYMKCTVYGRSLLRVTANRYYVTRRHQWRLRDIPSSSYRGMRMMLTVHGPRFSLRAIQPIL